MGMVLDHGPTPGRRGNEYAIYGQSQAWSQDLAVNQMSDLDSEYHLDDCWTPDAVSVVRLEAAV